MLSLVPRQSWVENRVISRLDSFLYTCGILYYTGISYKKEYLLHCIVLNMVKINKCCTSNYKFMK